MRFPKQFELPILLGALLTFNVSGADADRTVSTNGFTLKLRYGKEIRLTDASIRILSPKTEELVASSCFNSSAPLWDWKSSEILDGYRTTVAGNYLLLTFSEPRKIKTLGGDVITKEIIVGLNGPEYASSLYTIDEELRIVGHAKYSGPLCIDFLEWVKKVSQGP